MRRLVALLAGLVILAAVNHAVHQREQLLASGRVVLLELAPVDPRSLMQGDYMALRFAAAVAAFGNDRAETQTADGHLVLRVDDRGVGEFVRFDDGAALAPDEIRMRYRVRAGRPKFGTNAFFFEEGSAERYAQARYGELRVDAAGEAILTGLRDGDLRPL
ncbi:MAG: GDYXXLXY domain-containing protein [Gammaproteobacteria bacterium]|jgi:uncharacterized membrane-anchored protein|nr:GDYXXLXY domain-containing protein [Gammaproteobacteria bacterium]